MRLRAVALLFFCLTGVQSATAAGTPTVGQYVRAVHQIRLTLDGPSSAAPSAKTIARLKGEIRALQVVRLSDGRVLRTGMPLLATELAPDALSWRAVAVQIDALDNGLRALPRSGANQVSLSMLTVILRDPRFHPSCTLLQCLSNWIGNLLLSLQRRLNPRLPVVPAWLIAVPFLLLVLVIAVLVFRSAVSRTAANVLPAALPAEMRLAASREQAAQLAAAGDYRAALHYLFLATLLALHQQRGIDLRPGLTNRELLHAATGVDLTLPDIPVRRAALQALIDEFDRAWYGHLPFGASDYARCEVLAGQITGAGRESVA